MNNVKINGKEFPIKFSYKALSKICELKGIGLAQIEELFTFDKIQPYDIVIIAFAGLEEGARRLKIAFDLTIDDVDDLLYADIQAIGRIMVIYRNQNAAPLNPESPKKGAAKAKK